MRKWQALEDSQSPDNNVTQKWFNSKHLRIFAEIIELLSFAPLWDQKPCYNREEIRGSLMRWFFIHILFGFAEKKNQATCDQLS